jgi:hypothetical protein
MPCCPLDTIKTRTGRVVLIVICMLLQYFLGALPGLMHPTLDENHVEWVILSVIGACTITIVHVNAFLMVSREKNYPALPVLHGERIPILPVSTKNYSLTRNPSVLKTATRTKPLHRMEPIEERTARDLLECGIKIPV